VCDETIIAYSLKEATLTETVLPIQHSDSVCHLSFRSVRALRM